MIGMSPLVGRALTAGATVAAVGGLVLGVARGEETGYVVVPAAGLLAVAVAWVIVRHDPASPVGPALAWSASSITVVLANDLLAQSAETADPLPLAGLSHEVWVGLWPLNLAGVFALLLVFPDGRRPGRPWTALPFLFTGAALGMVVGMWGARQVGNQVVDEPTGWHRTLTILSMAAIAVSMALAVLSLVVRYRAGDERQRRQLRWLAFAGLVVLVSLLAGWVGLSAGAGTLVSMTPFVVAIVVLVPLAVGIAVVRHDLFDVDRLLSGSVAWLVTLVLSAAVFAATVTVASRALDANGRIGPTAAAFVTALLLLPLHRYVTDLVGRVVDRDRQVAVQAVERFAADVRLGRRQPEEIEAVLREAQDDEALQVCLLRPDGTWVRLDGGAVPEPTGHTIEAGGHVIARITLGWTSARARRRLADLAQAAWVPLEVSRLRLGLRDALDAIEASRVRLAEAAAAERKRLERDLHDGAQQRLVSTGMRLRLLQRRLQRGEVGAATEELDLAVAELEDTVAELRRIAHGVRPGRLDDGLAPALELVRAASPVPLAMAVHDLPELDDTRALTAYLVVSEAVTNALKHAHAGQIVVDVASDEDDRLCVDVRDDGIGGIPPTGLVTLRDRVQAVGGHLQVHSPAGGGTTVRAVL
jgi:signal transduction histidine kinase